MGYSSASGWNNPGWNVPPAGGGGGGGLDAATTSWINAVTGAGGTVSGTQQTRVDTLIKALKNATNGNLFTILDRLWLFAGESSTQQATIDIIALANNTNNGMTLSAGGYTGNGATAFVDSGFTPSTAGGNWTQNSANFGAYVNALSGGDYIGGNASNGVTYAYLSAGTFAAELNSGGFPAFTTSLNGLYAIFRNSSTTFNVARNAGVATALTDTTTGVINNKIFIGASCNNVGAAQHFTSDAIKAAWFGGGLTSAQATDLANAINAYMTAWGVNTY